MNKIKKTVLGLLILAFLLITSFSMTSCTDLDEDYKTEQVDDKSISENDTMQSSTGGDADDPVEPGENRMSNTKVYIVGSTKSTGGDADDPVEPGIK